MPGRWEPTAEEVEFQRRQKADKEEKKRLKAEKAQRATEAEAEEVARRQLQAAASSQEERPSKRQRTAEPVDNDGAPAGGRGLPRQTAPGWGPSRSVDNFERLNHIEEGSYGWVSRARDILTGDVVALKKLKMDGAERDGFPVTGLREIQCLMAMRHRHIVELREVVVGKELHEVYLVMDFLEHDLKTLQEDMAEPFVASETKTLMIQLASAVDFLHSHWILHRDLKTSNILMNNRGEIKLADFGMARFFGDPAPKMTQLVVTLWYRSPELLLGAERYGTAVDVWSLGCIFGELLTREPMFQGKNEVDQLGKIFQTCGVPSEANWPGYKRLPNAKGLRLPPSKSNAKLGIREKFPKLTGAGVDLLTDLLALNPDHRPEAGELLSHPYFHEQPRPKPTSMFPTFPSKARQERRRRFASPPAPRRGDAPKIESLEMDLRGIFARQNG